MTARGTGRGAEPGGRERGGQRRALLRWSGRFFLLQAALVALLSLRYVLEYPWPDDGLARFYTLAAWLGQSGLLALAAWVCAVLPVVLIAPRRRLVQALSVVAGAALLAFVLIDSLVFAQDRFHIDALALRVLGASTWGFALIYFAIFAAFSAMAARFVGQRLARGSGRPAAALAGAFAALFVASQALYAWADAQFYVPITAFTPYLPLYRPVTAKHLLADWMGAVNLQRARAASEVGKLGAVQGRVLDYPKQPLHCTLPAKPLNVLIIGIDSMRADRRVPRTAPSLTAFAPRAIEFTQNWSGGNGTRPGLFSLFYGVPATYWEAFYSAQQAPVLVQTFQSHGYDMGIFPSNPPDQLVGLDRTAFRTIPNLPKTLGDPQVTEGWLNWIAAHDRSKPFFGFLFYESAPGGCRPDYPRVPGADVTAPGEQGRMGCYDIAVHFADSQVGQVLADAESRGLFDDTVILITSDHGESFDENGQGFKGHGSGYEEYQLHTPLLVHWPGRPPGVVNKRTSHNDIAPTLLGEVLGCDNPPSDYGSGWSLFSDRQWDWLISGSYTSFAVVEPDQITISYGSYYEVRDPKYRVLPHPQMRDDVLSAALRETARFFRRP